MTSVINTAGWHMWGDSSDVTNVYYGEYANTGDGATGTRVSWSKQLSSAVSMSTVLGSSYASQSWYDSTYT